MTVWLSCSAATVIRDLAELFDPVETGGVLLGWRDGSDRIVTGLVGPGPKALHGRYTFLPDHPWQIARIREAFDASEGDLDYLGDWHTHPDGVAQMSEMDCKTLSRIERRVKSPLMMIAAGSAKDWTINGWTGFRPSFFANLRPHKEPVMLFDPPDDWPSFFS
ncbi:Mov34/MPN/PAD-1 family protein [Sphingobium indicum]|uniref:Mov34/MPN/PAD-1 family protein n=1 Tax=Sphingobium indicum TaxID=332055 RepID=UPI0035EC6A7C